MVASVTVVPANAQSVRWDMPNEYPATSPQGETDQFFSQRLSELSQGDIKIGLIP
jgi:TRAP-type C4-dicarboxylate transport system substrate-binding protein